ncbi:hypothetical protein Rpal_1833 [Rhodopseudomonas palustris TIE-1]|nr:hypothetical protein Rpal_1833 [Rhodopseudomonas palustris TIE-1]
MYGRLACSQGLRGYTNFAKNLGRGMQFGITAARKQSDPA